MRAKQFLACPARARAPAPARPYAANLAFCTEVRDRHSSPSKSEMFLLVQEGRACWRMRLSLLKLYLQQIVTVLHCGTSTQKSARGCSVREEREALPQVSWLTPGVRRVWEHHGGVEYAGQHKATGIGEPAVGQCEGGRASA